jgi:prefoldin subunit 5
MSAEAIVGIIALALSVAGLFVLAGKLLAAVENLTEAVKELKETIAALESAAQDHDKRLFRLEQGP